MMESMCVEFVIFLEIIDSVVIVVWNKVLLVEYLLRVMVKDWKEG